MSMRCLFEDQKKKAWETTEKQSNQLELAQHNDTMPASSCKYNS